MSRLAFLHPALLGMGLHVAGARTRRALFGHRRHPGTAEDILRAGLEECWSGRYLTASPGHYRQFWTRDTGFAAPSLVRLGGPWPDRLVSTLEWAMAVWHDRRSHVTTTINPLLRWPVDIFDYGVDSLPLLLASLQALASSRDAAVADRARALVDEHRGWIAEEISHFVEVVVDPTSGLVRTDRAFSAHRDTFRNGSTAYANAMVALLGRVVLETGWGPDLLSHHFVDPLAPVAPVAPLAPPAGTSTDGFVFPNSATESHVPLAMPVAVIRAGATRPAPAARIPATRITEGNDDRAPEIGHTNDRAPNDRGRDQTGRNGLDWGLLLQRHFWAGDRFRDRLGTDETSGEANVWPFHLGVIDDDAMLSAALETLRREGFTTPYPLKFEASHRADGLLFAYRLWSADYQTTTSWTSLGSIYLALLRRIDPAAAHVELDRIRSLIERDGTFWEVLDGSGRPWRSRSHLSISDVSMLWGAILLETFEADLADRAADADADADAEEPDEYATDTYRWWHRSTVSPELEDAVADRWLPPVGRVLDLGCGLGVDLGWLAGRDWDSTGIDLSAVAIERARRERPNVEFLVGDVLELPFEDGAFDVLLDRGCFHYLDAGDRPRYEAEAWRVLKPGGRFLLRACLTSGGERNDLPEDLVPRYFGRWVVASTAEREIPSDRRQMRAVVARLEKPLEPPDD